MNEAQATGLCQCGCGGAAPIAPVTNRRYDHVKGQPMRFRPGHNRGPWFAIAEGQRFGRLVATADREPHHTDLTFRCDCGTLVTCKVHLVAKGDRKSCGCLAADYAKRGGLRTTTRMNVTHGMTNTPTYLTWGGMVQRTTNPDDPAWAEYGARGITIDPRWLKFDAFLADMGERPDGLSLDRIDNDAGYCKANCRWADRVTQNRNQRPRRNSRSTLNYDERREAILALAAQGIGPDAIADRLSLGRNTVRRHLRRKQ